MTEPAQRTGRPARARRVRSLRRKFMRTLLLVAAIIGLSTSVTVGILSAQASAEHLRAVRHYIEEGIASKGKVLTENHALALRGLTLDNAFLEMQHLLERAITDDSDLVYGVYVSSDKETLALARRPLTAARRMPAREAWRDLGLKESELLVKSLRVEPTHRFGQDLLEVAAPVVDEDGELLGTVRYGLSTKRMHDALDAAQAESKTRLERSLVLLGLLVGSAMALGMALSRTEAVRITRPIGELTLAAERLAAGDHAVHVDIRSNDELEVLGESFNRMVEDLGASYKNLEEMNRTLEQKVAVRTVELADRNRDMRLVLDNIDQGFVTLSTDGIMAQERSRQVDTWFGAPAGEQHFWAYMASKSPRFAMAFEVAWSQIAEDFLPLSACLLQLPERLTSAGRTWSFRYLPFFRDDELEGVLVAITEITDRLTRENEDAEHADLMQAFKCMVEDRSGFEVFLTESSSMVDSVCSHELDAEPVRLKRALHTLKGTSGSMGLAGIAQVCHALESELAEDGAASSALLEKLRDRWQAMRDQLARSGLRFQRTVEIPEQDFVELVGLASDASVSRRQLAQRLAAWQAEPVERAFRRLADQALGLARRFDKELRVVLDTDGVRVDRARLATFFRELVHVLRNAVDHGIEAPEERTRLGKQRAGVLTLRARASESELSIEVADDGAGIDWDTIRRIAAERRLPHDTQAELVDVLCTDGVTTRDEVTSVSGRGVGMAAVRQCVLALRGELEVRSTHGRGTSWLARFPLTPAGEDALGAVFSSRPSGRLAVRAEGTEQH